MHTPLTASTRLLAMSLLLCIMGLAAHAATTCDDTRAVKKAVHKKAVVKKSKHPLDLLKK